MQQMSVRAVSSQGAATIGGELADNLLTANFVSGRETFTTLFYQYSGAKGSCCKLSALTPFNKTRLDSKSIQHSVLTLCESLASHSFFAQVRDTTPQLLIRQARASSSIGSHIPVSNVIVHHDLSVRLH